MPEQTGAQKEKDAVKHYDPMTPPESSGWLALDEHERIDLVHRFHERSRIEVPNARLHAAFHVVVENQLAVADATVQATMERLLQEGLDRHDALHAIGSILVEHIWNAMQKQTTNDLSPATYYRDLEALSADTWRSTHDSPE